MDANIPEGPSLVAIGRAVSIRFSTLLTNINSDNRMPFLNELQRFELWASNLGLYSTGHGSLDYRFRDSPPFFDYAFSLLRDLENALSSLMEVTTEENVAFNDDTSNSDDDEMPLSDEDEEEDFSSYQVEDLAKQYLGNISTTVDRLYALSFRIRNPAMRTGLSRAIAHSQVDQQTGVDLIQAFSQWDFNHLVELFRVWWKHNEVKDHFLVRRLAQANTRRRQQFKYWGHRKAKYEYHHQSVVTDHYAQLQPEISQKEGLSQPPTMSGLQPSRPSEPSTATHLDPSNIPDSESVVSIDSYATIIDDINELTALPPPPKVAHDSKEFECPYCFIMCSRKTLEKQAWGRHVTRDLRPYVCTFENCKEPDQLYDAMSEWIAHESSGHGYKPDIPKTCQFCSLEKASAVHIASHLRRIACFSLPRFRGETAQDASGTEPSSNINMGASDAADGSMRSSVYDEWADSAKHIDIHVPNFEKTTIVVQPGESTEDVLTVSLISHSDFGATSKFEFTDMNGSSIPVDYDSLYSGMKIYARVLESPASSDHQGESDLLTSDRKKHINSLPLSNIPRISVTPSASESDISLPQNEHQGHSSRRFDLRYPAAASMNDLDLRYAVQPRTYYQPGKVFSVLLYENPRGRFGALAQRTAPRMVVTRVFEGYSCCFGIRTSGSQGVLTPEVDNSNQATIYVKGTTPFTDFGGPPMTKDPLPVTLSRDDVGLEPMSMVDFGEIYSVKHSDRIAPIGEISPEGMENFLRYSREIFRI